MSNIPDNHQFHADNPGLCYASLARFMLAVVLLSGFYQNAFAQFYKPIDSKTAILNTTFINQELQEAGKIKNADSAIALYNKIITQSLKLKFHKGVLESLMQTGNAYHRKGNTAAAISASRKGLSYIAKVNKGINYTVGFYSNLGISYCDTGQYDSAISYYYKAVNTVDKYPPPLFSKAIFLNNIGTLYNTLGQYDAAIPVLKRGLTIAQSERKNDIKMAILQNIGIAFTYKNDLDTAASYLKQALALTSKQYPVTKANILTSLAALYEAKKQPEKALHYYNEALSNNAGKKYEHLRTLANLGFCYYQLKHYQQADSTLSLSLQGAKQVKADFLPNIYGMLAKNYKALGNYSKATDYYDLYIDSKDSLFSNELKNKIAQLQFQYETAQKNNELIKKELLISRQKVSLQNRNLIIYTVSGLSIAFIGIIVFYFRNRRKTERQQEERARWRASLEGEETERKRIAKELHDNIGGTLSTVKMWFQTIGERSQLSDSRQEYGEALSLLGTALNEVRNTAHNLMPELLLSHGLAEAVRIFCGNVQRATGIEADYRYLGYIGDIEKGVSLVLYRTVQELVQNVVKHAKATHLLVQLSMHENTLSLTVEDNGKGMDLALLPDTAGMGLRSARNNIEKLGGDFQLHSESGNGTTVDIDIVLGLEAA